jgi:hypothetical protein
LPLVSGRTRERHMTRYTLALAFLLTGCSTTSTTEVVVEDSGGQDTTVDRATPSEASTTDAPMYTDAGDSGQPPDAGPGIDANTTDAVSDGCVPTTTCAAQGRNCGQFPDGCGNTIDCMCNPSEVCASAFPDGSVCITPRTTDGGQLGDICPNTTACSMQYMSMNCNGGPCVPCHAACRATSNLCCWNYSTGSNACIPYGGACQ